MKVWVAVCGQENAYLVQSGRQCRLGQSEMAGGKERWWGAIGIILNIVVVIIHANVPEKHTSILVPILSWKHWGAHDTVRVRMPVLNHVRGMEATPWYPQLGVWYVYGYKKSTLYPYPSIPLSRNTWYYLYLCLSLPMSASEMSWL